MNNGDAYYFGCIRQGHFFYDTSLTYTRGRPPIPWTQVDCALAPGVTRSAGGMLRNPVHQPEGIAALHHKDGWTALAFWDRSVDARPGCNSVFLLRGTLTFDEAVAAARAAFPTVWNRFTFEVVAAPAPRSPEGGGTR